MTKKKQSKRCKDFDNFKFGPDYSVVRQRGMWYIHTTEGVLMSEIPWKDVDVISQYVIAKSENDSMSLLLVGNNAVIPILENVENIEHIQEHYFVIANDGKRALYNGSNVVVDFDEYEEIIVNLDFLIILIKYHGKYIVTDLSGTQLINMCDDIILWKHYYSDIKVIKYLQGNEWGLFRIGIGIIIPCKMNRIEFQSGGYVECLFGDKRGIYDLDGNVILKHRYFQIKRYDNIFKASMKMGKKILYGVWDLKGNEVLPCEFSRVIINNEKGTIEGEKIIRRVIKRIPN